MKKIIFIVFLVLLFGSCEKNNSEFHRFLATSETHTNDTKTHLEPNIAQEKFDVIWDANDQIIVYGGENTYGIFTNENVYDDSRNQVAHFSGSVVSSGTFYSFYPASIGDDQQSFTLPSIQRYRLKSDGYVYDYPMYAQENSNSNHLYFKNLCSLCIVRIHTKANTQVRSVTIREPNDPYNILNAIAGSYSVHCDGSTQNHNPSVMIQSNPSFDVKLDCSSNIQTLTDGKMLFYFSIPEGSHNWLIIGLEYKDQNSSDWNTTWKTIYASKYSAENFIFERSKWCAIDVDFSEVRDNEIHTTNDITFDPSTSDTVINTGVRLTETYDSYTFLVDVTPDDVTEPYTYQRAIFSEMDYDSPWHGPLIRIDGYASSLYTNTNSGSVACYQFNVSNKRVKGPEAVAGQRQKFVCVVNTSTNKIYLYWLYNNSTLRSTSVTISSSLWLTNSDPNSQIGGDQHKPTRYFSGIVHTFSINKGVWSTSEIRNWLSN